MPSAAMRKCVKSVPRQPRARDLDDLVRMQVDAVGEPRFECDLAIVLQAALVKLAEIEN
jgi:hypothetical protein